VFGRRLALLLALLLGATACPGATTRAPPSPPLPRDPPPPVTSTLIRLANDNLAAGRWASARRRAEETLARDPDNADAYAVLGAAYWRGGDYVASTAAYEAALARQPDNFGAGVGLGRNLQATGAHARALALQDRLLADEPDMLDPLLIKLWSQYALLDVDAAIATLDRLLRQVALDDPLSPVLLARAGFLRPLAGRGPLLTIAGARGTTDLQLQASDGIRHSLGVVGTAGTTVPTRVVLLEMREEARIDRALADRLGLRELGRFIPFGDKAEAAVVIVPRVAFGELVIHDVPAIVSDLSAYDVGETPGLLLGRQALQRIGSITYDFPRATLDLAAAAPDAPPPGSAAAPLILLNVLVFNAPATALAIEGSPHTFHSFIGGNYGCGVAVTRRNFLESGHLPRELASLDDPGLGLQMIYVEGARIGDAAIAGGMGGLVLANTPPDTTLGSIVSTTGFELGGYINVALLRRLSLTYVLSRGQLYVAPSR
jgi:tetratricopeptide (TPR) repeat protein